MFQLPKKKKNPNNMTWNGKIQLGGFECSRVQLSCCRCRALKSWMELILSQMYGKVSNCFAAPFMLIARCGSQLSIVFVLLLTIPWNWPLEKKGFQQESHPAEIFIFTLSWSLSPGNEWQKSKVCIFIMCNICSRKSLPRKTSAW